MQVYLGTSNGAVVVLDVHNGNVLGQLPFAHDGAAIRHLAFSCPRFKMEEPAPLDANAALHAQGTPIFDTSRTEFKSSVSDDSYWSVAHSYTSDASLAENCVMSCYSRERLWETMHTLSHGPTFFKTAFN